MATLEFFDYIFDRYAYLELEKDAPIEDISAQIRLRRAATHPDKLLRVSPSVMAAADRERELIDECARMLLVPEMREMYDAKLAEFNASEPYLVSSDGVACFDPSRFRIDLDYLLGSNAQSTEKIAEQARHMSGMDEKRIAKARKRALADPNDLDARDALRDELTKKLVFLSAMEDCLWQAAGVNGALTGDDHNRAQEGSHFEEKLAEKMEAFKERASQAVVQREGMASLGMAPRLLLAGPEGSGAEARSLTTELCARVAVSLEERSAALREAVAEKAKAIDELALYPRWAWAGDKRATPILDIVMVKSDEDYDENWPGADFTPVGFLIRIDRETGNAEPLMEGPTAQELADWPNAVVALEANPEIPGLFIEAFALASKLSEIAPESEPKAGRPAGLGG